MHKYFVLFVALLLASCSNEPTAELPKLRLSILEADSAIVTQDTRVHFTIKAQTDGGLVSGVTIHVKRPGTSGFVPIGITNAQGELLYIDSSVQAGQSTVLTYTFYGTRDGNRRSDDLVYHATLIGRLRLTFSGGDTIRAIRGEPLNVETSVAIGSTAVVGAAVTIIDPFLDQPFTHETNLSGTASFTINPNLSGIYTLRGVATKGGYLRSDTVAATVIVGGEIERFAATSLSSSSVALQWEAVPGYTGAYQLLAWYPSSTTMHTGTTSETSAVFQGLPANTEISFSVETSSGDRATMRWATARRFPSEIIRTQTIRLFESVTPPSVGPSALIIGSTEARAVTPDSTNDQDIDLVLATDDLTPITGLSLASPSVSSITGIEGGKQVGFSESYYFVAEGLDKDFYSVKLSTLIAPSNPANIIEIPQLSGGDAALGRSIISPLRIPYPDGLHYARVEIVPQADGQFYGMQGEYKFCDVRISYQTLATLPYAIREFRTHGSESARRTRRALRK